MSCLLFYKVKKKKRLERHQGKKIEPKILREEWWTLELVSQDGGKEIWELRQPSGEVSSVCEVCRRTKDHVHNACSIEGAQ